MSFFNIVTILSVASAICFLPTYGQTGNIFDCARKIVCNLEPYLNPCCLESFKNENETLDKKEMFNCFKAVLFKEAAACMNGGSQPGGDGGSEVEVEGQRYRKRGASSESFWSRYQREHSASSGFGSSFPTSSKRSRQRARYGGLDDVQSEDCDYVKNNEPKGTEDCPTWSGAVARCCNEIQLIKSFCQGGNLGGGLGGMSGSSLFHGTENFGRRNQGSLGGRRKNGFKFSWQQGSFGGGGTGFDGFSSQGAFGGNHKPKGDVSPQKPPNDEREYEET